MHIRKPSLNNKYFYIKTKKNLLKIRNRKKLIRIPNLQNRKNNNSIGRMIKNILSTIINLKQF